MSLENAYNTCMEMIEQRGYSVVSTGDTIKADKGNGDILIIFFHNCSKLTKKDMSKYMTTMKEENSTHSILVYADDITSMSSKSVDQSIEMKIELFELSELQVNITKHRLQPSKFNRLSSSDSANFKKQYGSKFPVMKISDPIARFYDYDRGDVIEITQKTGLVTYRIVY
jgi:DNA-directed RNA polymerase I, II, and III subunit RPABC1